MDTSVLVVAIASIVYVASLALMNLPLKELKAWGRSALMHSLTGIALFSIIPTLIFVRNLIAPYVQPYIGVDISVGPETALAHVRQYQTMIMEWINAVNLSALAIRAMQAILMLALTPLMLVGTGVLFATIASYLFSAVFGGLILAQKFFSALYLFSEIVRVFISIVPFIGPGMFTVGLILFATPFARKLGKTLIVLGAALTLILPPVVVATLPGPEEAEEEIRKTKEIQAYSIALDKVRQINAGVKINMFDRNGTIQRISGGQEKHDSRMVKYPYFKLELQGRENAPPLLVDCSTLPPGVSCENVTWAVLEMLKQPETGFINSGQEKIEEGYRATLTMIEMAGVGRRAGTFMPDAWILGLWMYMQGDTGKRDEPVRILGAEIKEEVGGKTGEKLECNDVTCWWEDKTSGDFYEDWKAEWEKFWNEAPYKKLYLENAVQEGYNTSLIWFTKRPVGSDQPLNVFVIYPGVQSVDCRIVGSYQEGNETKYRYGVFVKLSPAPITYFTYVDGAEYSVESDMPIDVREVNASELVGRVVKGAENLNLKPSIPTYGTAPPDLEASPPAHYMLVYFKGGEFQMGEGDSCEEAYRRYLENVMNDLMLEDDSTNPYVDDYRQCFQDEISSIDQYLNSTNNESGNSTETEIIPEPDETNSTSTPLQNPPCVESGAVIPLPVTVEFNLIKESPAAPYKPNVEWEKFDMDEEYKEKLASGGYVSEEKIEEMTKIDVETHREEWASSEYETFRPGLYRDGPVHYGQRLVVGKLMEYKTMNWAKSPVAKIVYDTFMYAAKKAGESIPGGGVPIPTINVLVSGDQGITLLDALAKLLGHTIALALALIVFAVAADAVSGIIGGQSAMKTVLASPVTAIYSAFHHSRTFAIARRTSKAGIAGYLVGRKREREMLKSAEEERKRDHLKWKEAEERRLASMRIHRRAVERVRSTVGEKLLDLKERFDERGGILGRVGSYITGELAKKHTLATHGYLLRTDPSYASRHLDQARYVSQMKPVAMTPEKWAEGMAHMIKTAPTKLEKIALIDRIVRDPSMGRNILIKEAFGGLAEEVSWLTGGRINIPISREIKAPAAFAIAAENASKPLMDELGGRRPDIPHVIPADFSVGLITRGLDHVEAPYIHGGQDPYTTLREIHESISFYDTYSRPLSPDEKTELSQTLANMYIDLPGLEGEVTGGKYVEVEAKWPGGLESSDSRLDGVFWFGLEKPEDLESLPSKVADSIDSSRIAVEAYKLGETHEGSLTESREGYWLPSDVLTAFPWTAQDALDKFASEGYSFSEAFENTSRSSDWWEAGDQPHQQAPEKHDKSEGKGWWE